MTQRKNKRRRVKAAYDDSTKKGTGLLVDGGNGFYYVVSHIPVKIGIANDRDVNPKLVDKLVQFSLDDGVVDDEGHITGVVGNWVGPATDSQKEDVEPYVEPDILSPAEPPPMGGGLGMDMGMGLDAPGPMDMELGMEDPLAPGPMDMDLGMEDDLDMGGPPDLGGPMDVAPPDDILGPPVLDDLPPAPNDIPIASGHKRKSSKQRLKLWEASKKLRF